MGTPRLKKRASIGFEYKEVHHSYAPLPLLTVHVLIVVVVVVVVVGGGGGGGGGAAAATVASLAGVWRWRHPNG